MSFNIKNIATEAGVSVLAEYNLIDYDDNMTSLYHDLKKFENYNFSPNERIIFLHIDIEFIVGNLRFTLYNLQKILASLSIPNFACIVAGQQDVKKDLHYLQTLLTDDTFPIGFVNVEGNMFDHWKKSAKVDLNIDNIQRQYIFLSYQPRVHRDYMISWLAANRLIDNGLVSYRNALSKDGEKHLQNYQINHNLDLLSTVPWNRINDGWNVTDKKLRDIFSNKIDNFKNFEENTTKREHVNQDILQRAFCYVTNETVFNYPCSYTSEKSYKSFASMRPMISYGAAGNLRRLKSFGFKTFNEWWSEDYDFIEDPTLRFKAVADTIQYVASKSIDECALLLKSMLPTLQYNQNLYLDSYPDIQHNILHSDFKNNLRTNV